MHMAACDQCGGIVSRSWWRLTRRLRRCSCRAGRSTSWSWTAAALAPACAPAVCLARAAA